MRGLRAAAFAILVGAAALLGSFAPLGLGTAPALAQEEQEALEVVPDTLFVEKVRVPANYQTSYDYDQSRDNWTQSLGYNPSWKNLLVGVNGVSSTSEDILESGRRSTNGDLTGKLDWRAFPRMILSMSGRHSMSSISEGGRSRSTSEQRRNALSFVSQYAPPPVKKAQFVVIGSTEFSRNYDLKVSERAVAAPDTVPQFVATQLDSSFASGRLDAVRGTVSWPFLRGFLLAGSAYGSRTRPVTTIRTLRSRTPAAGGSIVVDSSSVDRIQLPTDNAIFSSALTVSRIRGAKIILESKRTGLDQVYFDVGQLKLERQSSDGRFHHFRVEGTPKPEYGYILDTSYRQSLKEYVARPNLNALVTTRIASGNVYYRKALGQYTLNFDVSRARAERQSTGNGLTLTRIITANLAQRVLGRFWLNGLGSATLSSYRYNFAPEPGRTFSKDDRDLASAFGSLGARFSVTPRCSTGLTFSLSRSHNVAVDESQSAGNIATTVYQVNGLLRLTPSRNLSIWQDYIATATDRSFDYSQQRDGLSRNFRIETSIADTLFPFAFVRVDHRYFFFDQGSFSPTSEGGPRLYGPSTEQAQQALDGRIGIRPIQGVTLIVKQSLTDTDNRDLSTGKSTRTGQWTLSYSAEINRSFWKGAGITGSVRRDENYITQSNTDVITELKPQWLVSILLLKDF
ncbi:MAG TPA: hypothetical protein VFU59_11170 [Candidatus Eisenbacteria bacterium]|nr:hypothetical protein [Candidatus Eisenbacteria bacterium]